MPTTRYKEYSFTYNAFGQRTKKEYTYFAGLSQTEIDYLKSTVTSYYYDMQGRLVTENRTYTYGDGETAQKVLYFLYEESDVVGFIYFNSSDADIYYYDKNPRGDVVNKMILPIVTAEYFCYNKRAAKDFDRRLSPRGNRRKTNARD